MEYFTYLFVHQVFLRFLNQYFLQDNCKIILFKYNLAFLNKINTISELLRLQYDVHFWLHL